MARLSPAASAALLAALAALTVAASALLHLSYYVPATLLMAYALVPFLAGFERSSASAKQVALVAALCALAIASRAAFAFVPHFKPMAAVIICAGIACGARTGFLVGALSMLASNLMFGQGPWTPWQMLAYGLCGLVFGLLSERGTLRQGNWTARQRVAISIGGGLLVVFVAGPILDTSSLLIFTGAGLTGTSALVVYAAGLVPNVMQGIATAVTLLLAGSALVGIIARVRQRHGIP